MTPRLHTSTSGPSYFFPWKSSGAAYGGEPQKVSSLLPMVNSLLKPKSAILIFMSASNSRFSAWRDGESSETQRWRMERDCDSALEAKVLPLDLDGLFFSGDNTALQTQSEKKQKKPSAIQNYWLKRKNRNVNLETKPSPNKWMIIFNLISEYFYKIAICFAR